MAFSEKQIADLSAPLIRDHVKSRKQGGSSVSYIEGWHAIAEANRIFGYDMWTRETVMERCVSEKPRVIGKGDYAKDGWGVTYIAKVRITVPCWDDCSPIVREGYGAGHGIDADLGQAHESAIKEAETDAMKRALMTFGNPFGLALYDKEQKDVEDAPKKPKDLSTEQRTKINAAITQLAVMDEAGKLQWLGTPANFTMVKWLKDNAHPLYADFKALGVEVE